MKLSKFFRVALEGGTVDGRTIDRAWIEQMAAGYNRDTYTARINCEHLAGFSPEPPFNAYGSVHALKAEEVTIQLDGKPVKKLALLAQLEPNDQLVATTGKGQKLFTSVEIAPNFANTGKAGLVGLAITDNPASLGTEMLTFAATLGERNPFNARKKDAANHFSEAVEAAIELEDPADDKTGFAALMESARAFFSREGEKPKPPAPPELKQDAATVDLSALTARFTEGFDKLTSAIGALGTETKGDIAKLRGEHDALKLAVEGTDGSKDRRPPGTGGGASKFATIDC